MSRAEPPCLYRAEDADVETSSEGYARRFAGPVGRFFLERQAEATLDLLRPFPGASVLDVGGGHGQVTGPLVAAGHAVTRPRQRRLLRGARARVDGARGARASSPAICWPRRSPTARSTSSSPTACCPTCAAGRSWWRRSAASPACAVVRGLPDAAQRQRARPTSSSASRRESRGTRAPSPCSPTREVERAFASHGFLPTGRRPQFFFPMALHRGLRSAPLARGLEGAASGARPDAGPRFARHPEARAPWLSPGARASGRWRSSAARS